ncbi:MAG: phosphoenolpyruvate--protein phosphotransferase [Alphaproteobacteria bacterium]|nr:phosphoenolpyruvate--protein phosphotransferase [Alphaproteobacteria bacterium]
MSGVRTVEQSGAAHSDPASGPDLVLLAPFDGWAAPLSEVPDPVFADRMMGDGVAIDPLAAVLTAPCDGEIILLHAALHAVTLRAGNGAEILMHIGLDTVALGGRGFAAHVAQGQTVKAGDKLISFDLDQLAHAARSLITPIVITNADGFVVARRMENVKVARGQALMTVRRIAPAPAAAAGYGREVRRELVVPMVHGLHARPAARLAGLAKSFAAEIAILSGETRANVRSPVALMGLGLTKGARVTIVAAGADADEAAAALTALIESGMDEDGAPSAAAAIVAAPLPVRDGVLAGVRAAPGLALGVAVRLVQPDIPVEEQGQGAAHEMQCLGAALAVMKQNLQAAAGKNATLSAILEAHLGILGDPELAAEARAQIEAGKSAGYAWRSAVREQVAVLKGLKDPRLAERASDLIDLERQVLSALGGAEAVAMTLPQNAILLAEDILPSQLAGIDAARLAGLAMAEGGPTSHAAILAASMNIPALVACGPALLEISDGMAVLLDADHGRLTVDPSPAAREKIARQIAARRRARRDAQANAQALCHTKDGVRIEVCANLGSVEDAVTAVAEGAEGCGLLRTEFLFLNRQSPPGEDEQADVYRAIADALGGRPLIVRTLDIGGDKPAAYLPFPPEENPALGLRGVRVSLWRPDLLATQLRAILRGIPPAQCRIMVPMIASLDELRQVRRILDDARAALGIADPVSLGVMIETPAAAITADILAAEADFFSIGTNDLTQYSLAMDRGNARLAAQFDALHPAVLRLIAATAKGADRYERRTGVCGGLGSDVTAAPILIGLGVRSLSGTASQIAEQKAAIGSLTLAQCRDLAEKALAATSASDVRGLNPGD